MKAIKFLTACTVGSLYNKGEVAGFEDAVADDLIERKIAVEVKPEKGGKADKSDKSKDPVDPAKLDDAALDQLIADEKVAVDAGADREAKIAAVLAARTK